MTTTTRTRCDTMRCDGCPTDGSHESGPRCNGSRRGPPAEPSEERGKENNNNNNNNNNSPRSASGLQELSTATATGLYAGHGLPRENPKSSQVKKSHGCMPLNYHVVSYYARNP